MWLKDWKTRLSLMNWSTVYCASGHKGHSLELGFGYRLGGFPLTITGQDRCQQVLPVQVQGAVGHLMFWAGSLILVAHATPYNTVSSGFTAIRNDRVCEFAAKGCRKRVGCFSTQSSRKRCLGISVLRAHLSVCARISGVL